MNVAVVGANRGIGLELVKNLKDQGHTVYAFCRKASQELKECAPEAIVQNFEVTDFELMQDLLDDLDPQGIDQLFHVSGIMKSTSLEDFDVDKIMEQIEVNSVAPILSVKAFLPYLNESAKVGLITSRMGSIADNTSGGSYGYRMSKSALNAAGKSLAEDIKVEGITVLLLHPGWVQTDMTGHTGHVTANESAHGLIEVMKNKDIKQTGTFWHMNGEQLPW